MRFGDFLKSTVMLAATGASALVLATLAGIKDSSDTGAGLIAVGWWLAAIAVGLWLGRRTTVSEAIRSLLSSARTQASLPELHPGRTILNRLWPLLLCTLAAAAIAFVVPQVPAVVAGFMIIWSLAWRHQSSAVRAIEDRDGARFYVDRTPLLAPIRLVRTPGFRATMVEMDGAGRPTAQRGA